MSMRACDRCHQIKERCSRSLGTDMCERCSRLDLECLTIRPQRKTGRKPTFARQITYQKLATSSRPSDTVALSAPDTVRQDRHNSQKSTEQRLLHSNEASSHESLNSIADASDQELYLLSLALGDRTSAGRYVIGPSFHETHQRSLIKGLQTAPALLKDAFISCSTLIAAGQGIEVPALIQDYCQKRAAVGVSLLRAVKVSDREEASTCLLLGFLLVTFAKYVALGEVLAICRYTLGQIKPIYEANGNFNDEDHRCFLKHLVLTETIECLFQAEMPVIRLEGDENETVDRFLGISSSLLAPLHSLARLNCTLRNSKNTTHWNMVQELSDLESLISEWMPPAELEHLSDRFAPTEVNYMLKQAKVMQETMLLITHRLQHPYGSRSARADELSHSICNELELLKAQTGQTLNVAGLSLMATAFEVDDPSRQAEALNRIERLTSLSPSFQTRLRRSLLIFWSGKQHQQEQHQHCDLHWYDVSLYYLSPLSES